MKMLPYGPNSQGVAASVAGNSPSPGINHAAVMAGQSRVHVELEEGSLWNKFHRLTNEMIVTKNGRRMFPVIKTRVSGLEPSAFYEVQLEFKQIENNRFKYINGEWLAGEFNELYFPPKAPRNIKSSKHSTDP
jgi:hypothetical protein